MKTLAVLGGIAVFVAGVLWRGYVLSILWAWFLVPTLGAPQIGVAQALGVSLTAQVFHPAVETKEKSFGENVLRLTILPLTALCIGWVVKQFM